MHISEGVLSTPILLGGAILTGLGTAIGLKHLDYDKIMNVSILTATFFVASLIHIPIGPGSVHLVLSGMMGILLGWACFPAILVALFLQSIFFQYGGLVVLGTNTFIMAVPAICCFYLFKSWLQNQGKKRNFAAFLSGFTAVFLSSILMAIALAASDQGFIKTAQIVIGAHIPMMIIEGLITMFTISFLAKVQPEILTSTTP